MAGAGGELTPDIVSYNTVMKACGNAAQIDAAFQVCGWVLQPAVWPLVN
jgi:hypothetical protein